MGRPKGEKSMSGWDYFKQIVRYTLEREQYGTFPCFTLEAANYVVAKLNKKKIAYYSYFSQDCWIIKFDKSEEWMDQAEKLF